MIEDTMLYNPMDSLAEVLRGDILPVDPETVMMAAQVMAEAVEGRLPGIAKELKERKRAFLDIENRRLAIDILDHPMGMGFLAVQKLAKSKEKDPRKAAELSTWLNCRLCAFGQFQDMYGDYLKQYGLIRDDSEFVQYHRALLNIAATEPITDRGEFDIAGFFARLNELLGEAAVPVPSVVPSPAPDPPDLLAEIKSLEEMGMLHVVSERHITRYTRAVGGLLWKFAALRMVYAKADPQAATIELDDSAVEELADDILEWARSNPRLNKHDLQCLGLILRKEGYPKLIWKGIITDARGKTFHDLFSLLYTEEERSPTTQGAS